ncbi:FAD-dependent oxidoreductase [Rodentibacter caecimuris]|uniref:FAD-dependent oxidoreductase n=1 Tax=Rodentibacter caecimuris TaxID=1796644 RepID=A0A9X8W087_9PAST|nr:MULTISPECIES: NAD(P)/FAD-dependent oxidoreductase [Pasteurellaceae]AOF53655.1 NADH dehydrogenase [Pasteurellaceae bacterium NI1060]MCQ9124319.1 NAD(P)/FAD-dependent oxidoreductase [Rodentibacter heylii]MCR1837604.1 NAD(P)/FAD-dependent oxidoreductase [Pasteurella caecimuris]MCU0107990.1 NAD(P)/FAD-dependent oxidoreductase [Pasteurella caecimuris]MCX2962276.1 NAD(P)/FAD-dependent oxidoreductase [Rodentibacter heylii]
MKNVVVVGGGAGGVELATFLGNKLGRKGKAKITLVDRNATHLWKPLLHEIATGVMDDGIDSLSYRAHGKNHHFSFEQGSITRINREQKYVELAPIYGQEGDILVIARRIPYDYLVLAIGSKSNDFNTKGVAENCIFLDSSEQALRFQRKVLELFLKFSENRALDDIGEAEFKQKLVDEHKVNIAIVGGGATGVELTAELYHATEDLSSYGYGKIDNSCLQVTLVEAGPRLLPALPEDLSVAVLDELKDMGANVKLGTMITEARPNTLITKDGEEIKADLIVWAAGVRTSKVTHNFDGLEINRTNQLVVKDTLQTTVDESIFAIGDCAALTQSNGTLVPPRAQAAHQMAKACAKNIFAIFDNKPMKAFKYNDKGTLVSLSSFTALGSLTNKFGKNPLTVHGKFAQFAYVSLYRMHQHALHGCTKIGLIILVDKINRYLKPRLKLH